MSSVFSDSQEAAIVEFLKQHPELFDKEHSATATEKKPCGLKFQKN